MNNLLQIQNLRSIPLSNIIQHVVEGSSKAIEKQRAHEMRGFGGVGGDEDGGEGRGDYGSCSCSGRSGGGWWWCMKAEVVGQYFGGERIDC